MKKSESAETGCPLVLAVDDEQASINAIQRSLRREFDVVLALDARSALEVLRTQPVTVLLADQRMPEMTGIDLFREALKVRPEAVRILITGYTDIEATIESINAGQIFYYINKPWEPDDLRLIVRRAAERYRLAEENRRLVQELKQANSRLQEENLILHTQVEERYEFGNIIGQSKPMQEVFAMMKKVIPTDTTVMLLGETGTGKELIARAIHYNGPRKEKLFVAQNCAALPDTLLESELFGHEKGAFTGAAAVKRGLFELANGGTIFLDEIGDTSPAMQQRLLRVLQEGEIKRLGSETGIRVDVRIISATNRDLGQAIKSGRFREDLFYRLNVFPIRIPPLRERREDIAPLAEYFLQKYQRKSGKNIGGLEPEALKILRAATFPGNVRELENEMERVVALADPGSMISANMLSRSLREASVPLLSVMQQSGTLKEITEEIEKHLIVEKLREKNGNITHTATALGLSRMGLQKKMARYGLRQNS